MPFSLSPSRTGTPGCPLGTLPAPVLLLFKEQTGSCYLLALLGTFFEDLLVLN